MTIKEILQKFLPCIVRQNGRHDSMCTNCETRKRILRAITTGRMQDFKKGDRVLLTEKAVAAGVVARGGETMGTLTGLGRDSRFIRVRMDGNKSSQTFHQKFFVVVTRNLI